MSDLLIRAQTLPDRLRHIARTRPDHPFIILHDDPAHPLTFGDCLTRTERFATAYAARGIRPRDIIALMLPTHRDAAPAFFGAMMIGAIPAFFPPLSPKQDAAIFWSAHGTLFARIEPALIVSDAFNIGLIETHLPAFHPACHDIETPLPPPDPAALIPLARHDTAFLQHSSGTTGLKKGVMLAHGTVLDHVDAMAATLAITEADIIASWLPIYHDMGLIACFLAPALLGITVVTIDPFAWVRRASSLLDVIGTHRATLCWLPNFAFHHLIRMTPPDAHYDLSSLRAIIDCSEPCKPATLEAFRTHFAPHGLAPTAPQVSYAMAETVFMATQTPLGRPPRTLRADPASLDHESIIRPAPPEAQGRDLISCGPPMHGVRLRILDADGAACPDRQIGNVVISSETMFDGYFRLAMPPGKLESGWYHTGDRGFLDQGELFITGRTDDLLIIHGKNIYAHDVEFCLNANCAIKPGRAVAIAPFNPQTGSQSLVIIAESDNPDPAARSALTRAIKSAINAEFAATVYEALIVPPGWLIKTTSGKISRAENLRNYLADRPGFQADRA